MRVSLYPDQRLLWPALLDDCLEAEAMGWDGLWLCDHLLRPRSEPAGYFLECWTSMAALATVVPRMSIGSLVSANSLRHPGLVAAMALSIHQISGGRFVLGVGAGGGDDEHLDLGLPFPHARERIAALAEACILLRALLTPGAARHTGAHYCVDLDDTGLTETPRIPLLVGAAGPEGLKLVAEHADQWAIWGSPDELAAHVRVLDEHCRAAGRDPASIHRAAIVMVTTQAQADSHRWPAAITLSSTAVRAAVTSYARAGVGELIICDHALPRTDRSSHLQDLLAMISEARAKCGTL